MSRNKVYLEFLKQRFNETNFITFINDLLNLSSNNVNSDISEKTVTIGQYKEEIKNYKYIAKYNDGVNNIGVFIVNLKSTKTRSLQRNFAASLLNKYNLDASIVSFYTDNDSSWRLSFIKKELSFDDNGIKEKLTPAKRYSYLVGEHESIHTAQQYLLQLLEIDSRKITLSDIEKVFDVEKVTKEFFEKYKEKYLQLKEFLDKNEDFITESKKCDFTSAEFAKKLMGQIVFLYFLQKKGWLGVQLVPNELSIIEYEDLLSSNDSVSQNLINLFYEKNENKYVISNKILRQADKQDIVNFSNIFVKTKYDEQWGTGSKNFIKYIYKQSLNEHKNFFDEYLEQFFYEGLNEKRDNQYFPLFNCKIPFLNGGLFEPLSNYRWSSAHFSIPNRLFSSENEEGILDFLNLYNFTIDEEEPLEKDIAVDPEMLGKIFENLLDVNDRKSKGAFYTPREIVYYMCQESLANYLVNNVNVDYDETIQFIKYGEILSHLDWEASLEGKSDFKIGKTIYNNLLKIDKALIDVKIADPAVGSGAFPLGMLTEIVKIRDVISSYLLIQEDQGIIKLSDLNNTEHCNRKMYDMKLQTIENSIYAVDIELSAIDIAKLRLWLSLIVDYPNELEPKPLPNLDCKIMQGNSLIDEYQGIPLFNDKIFRTYQKKYYSQQDLFGKVADIHIQQSLAFDDNSINLIDYIDKMSVLQKEYFIQSDNRIKKELKEKIDNIQMGMVEASLTNEPQKLKTFMEESKKRKKPWFIWQLEFYDVFSNRGGFDIIIGNPPYVLNSGIDINDKKIYEKKYIVCNSHYDLYVCFYNLGLDILKKNGILTFITSNKWLNQKYGFKLRQLILSNKLIKLINFNNVKIFESATVDTEITVVEKNQKNLKINSTFENHTFSGCDFNSEMTINDMKMTNYDTKIMTLFDEYNFNLNITNDDSNIIKHIYNNSIPFEKICYISLGTVIHCKKSQNTKNEFLSNEKKDDYKNYLEGKDINKWKNKIASKFLNYTPNKHREPRFVELFENAKILCIRMSSKQNPHRFCLNFDDYVADSVIISKKYCDIPSNKYKLKFEPVYQDISYEYLLGLLNSNVLMYVFYLLYSDGLHFYPSHLKNMPIKVENVKETENIVKILINNSLDLIDKENYEKKLNDLIYKTYNLTNEEIQKIKKFLNE